MPPAGSGVEGGGHEDPGDGGRARCGEGDRHEEGEAAVGELDHEGNRGDRAVHGPCEECCRANERKLGQRPGREKGRPGSPGQGPLRAPTARVGVNSPPTARARRQAAVARGRATTRTLRSATASTRRPWPASRFISRWSRRLGRPSSSRVPSGERHRRQRPRTTSGAPLTDTKRPSGPSPIVAWNPRAGSKATSPIGSARRNLGLSSYLSGKVTPSANFLIEAELLAKVLEEAPWMGKK